MFLYYAIDIKTRFRGYRNFWNREMPPPLSKSVISIGGVAEDTKSELFYSFEADLYSWIRAGKEKKGSSFRNAFSFLLSMSSQCPFPPRYIDDIKASDRPHMCSCSSCSFKLFTKFWQERMAISRDRLWPFKVSNLIKVVGLFAIPLCSIHNLSPRKTIQQRHKLSIQLVISIHLIFPLSFSFHDGNWWIRIIELNR